MNNEIEFDHFKDINDLLKNIDSWYREDDIEYTRWFGLEDLYNLKIYITSLQQKVEQLEKENKILKYLVDDSHTMKAFIVEHNKVEQLENIRKEAIEYIEENSQSYSLPDGIKDMRYVDFNKLLNILNKGGISKYVK